MLAVLKVLFVKADADAVVKQQIKVTWKTWMRLACVRDGYVDPFSPYNVLVLTKYTVDCFLFAFLFIFAVSGLFMVAILKLTRKKTFYWVHINKRRSVSGYVPFNCLFYTEVFFIIIFILIEEL